MITISSYLQVSGLELDLLAGVGGARVSLFCAMRALPGSSHVPGSCHVRGGRIKAVELPCPRGGVQWTEESK